MTEWRNFEPCRENVEAAKRELERNTCNMHSDCAAADELVRAAGGRMVRVGAYGHDRVFTASHCHSEDCEECFGC